MAKGLVEGEIRKGIADGGRLRNVVVVRTADGPESEHLAYVLTSWRREFLPLRTWGSRSDRTYKDVDRLLSLIREDFAYRGVIQFYVSDDPDLQKYRALAPVTTDDASMACDPVEQEAEAP